MRVEGSKIAVAKPADAAVEPQAEVKILANRDLPGQGAPEKASSTGLNRAPSEGVVSSGDLTGLVRSQYNNHEVAQNSGVSGALEAGGQSRDGGRPEAAT